MVVACGMIRHAGSTGGTVACSCGGQADSKGGMVMAGRKVGRQQADRQAAKWKLEAAIRVPSQSHSNSEPMIHQPSGREPASALGR